MKKYLICFVLSAALFCSCQTEISENSSYESERVTESSEVQSSFAETTSAVEESSKEFSAPELKEMPCVEVTSLSGPLLYLPFHTSDDLPTDFVKAMAENPLDKDFLTEFSETDAEASTMYHLVWSKYVKLWETEITETIDSLCTALGDEYRDGLQNFATNSIEIALDKVLLEGEDFLSLSGGAYLGSAVCYQWYGAQLDAYRQIGFKLKYWLYLIETHDLGMASSSLQFVYEGKDDARADELTVVTSSDGFVIQNTYAPSYTAGNEMAFVEAMRYNPIDQLDDPRVDHWKSEIEHSINVLNEFLDDVTAARIYSNAFLDCRESEIVWYTLLIERGYVDASHSFLSDMQMDAYRQLTFTLKYWGYLFETQKLGHAVERSLQFSMIK